MQAPPKPPAAITKVSDKRSLNSTFAGLESANNFDFLRFVAATMVIFSHCYPLSGRAADPLARASGETLGTVGVSLFFALSGFLICKSWLTNPTPMAFISARCLRIFPGLFFSLIVTVFLIGPLVTKLSISNYFSNPETYKFLENIFLFPVRYSLPGAFTSNPFAGAVNGSLWSLPVEFLMYGVMLTLGAATLLAKKWFLPAATASLYLLDVFVFSRPEFANRVELTVLVGPSVHCSIFFLIGSVFYRFRENIPASWLAALAAAALYVLSFKTPFLRPVELLALPYLFFMVAKLPVPMLRGFGKHGDFSYGLYVFAFPIQQTIIHFWGHQHPVSHIFALSFFCTLAWAVLSWHLIESPALTLKSLFRTKRKLSPGQISYERGYCA